MERITKFRIGKYRYKVTLYYVGERIYIAFDYQPDLIKAVKSMQGARWHGFDEEPVRMWSFVNNARNQFQMDFLEEKNPYAIYDAPLINYTPKRKEVFDYQVEMIAHAITRRRSIFACEMGTGKTLAAIETLEYFQENENLQSEDVWFVGPLAAIYAVKREFFKWQAKIKPSVWLTYEQLAKHVISERVPKFLICDEISKARNPTAQRSRAVASLANLMKLKHGDPILIGMSGTPAPKSPEDWWNICEIICPGFLKEGDPSKFKARLCLIEQRESPTGGCYPHVITWLDDERKCAKCGEFKESEKHNLKIDGIWHPFEPSKNEVAYLNQRLQGLVLVKFKKDCAKHLPEKFYEEIIIPPTPEVLRAAKLLKTRVPRALTLMSLLRQLSDGFQYQETEVGKEVCKNCKGTGKCVIAKSDNTEDIELKPQSFDYVYEEDVCENCGGTGQAAVYKQSTEYVQTGKDEAFINELDNMEEWGRFVVWAGFTASIDKLVDIAHKQGWCTIRYDGTIKEATDAFGVSLDFDECMDAMDLSNPRFKELQTKIPKLVLIGNSEAGGISLTLTGSPVALYYSNSFKGEARMQSEDRIHRAGMDVNKGATIKDLIYLPSDRLVLENLKKKKRLQDLTMGQIEEAFEQWKSNT